jgi:drug/metabolite transporter (DMT)-like permease
VIIAAWLAGEEVTLAFMIGGALVLAGVWLGGIRSAAGAGRVARPGEHGGDTGDQCS